MIRKTITSIEEFTKLIQLLDFTTFEFTIFGSKSWLLSWIEHYWRAEWEVLTFIYYDTNGLVIGFAPFYIQKKETTTLTAMGQGEAEFHEISSEYFDIYIAPEYSQKIVTDIAFFIKKHHINEISFKAIFPDSKVMQVVKCLNWPHRIRYFTRYQVNKAHWDINLLKKSARYKYRKSLRQLKKQNAEIFWVKSDEFSKYFDKLIELHKKRWNEQNKVGAFSSDNFINFHRNFIEDNELKKQVKISAIKIEEEVIAINYYYLSNTNILHFYQSGWHSIHFKGLSLGFTLHMWSIINSDTLFYDFMMGSANESYKNQFYIEQAPMLNIVTFTYLRAFKILIKKVKNKLSKTIVRKLL